MEKVAVQNAIAVIKSETGQAIQQKLTAHKLIKLYTRYRLVPKCMTLNDL